MIGYAYLRFLSFCLLNFVVLDLLESSRTFRHFCLNVVENCEISAPVGQKVGTSCSKSRERGILRFREAQFVAIRAYQELKDAKSKGQ